MTTGDYLSIVMKVVGIKQLKARLSEYVRLARQGETVLVMDRDEVVAELRPARHRIDRPVGPHEEVLEELAAAGELQRALLPKKGWTWKPKGLGLPAGTAQKLLDEIRGDPPEGE